MACQWGLEFELYEWEYLYFQFDGGYNSQRDRQSSRRYSRHVLAAALWCGAEWKYAPALQGREWYGARGCRGRAGAARAAELFRLPVVMFHAKRAIFWPPVYQVARHSRR